MELTESQQRAITTESREVLVIAGAGAGKTGVLTRRVAHLIDRGSDPSQIMVLTFTRKAAAEMRARLAKLLEESGKNSDKTLRQLTMGTFHSIGLSILQQHGNRIGYGPDAITVATEDDADMLLEQVAKRLGFLIGKQWRYELSLKKVKQFREAFYTTGEMVALTEVENQQDRAMLAILNEYKARLFSMNCIDFGLILTEVQRLFREAPDVLAIYNARFAHVLVDECQDLNQIQYGGFLDFLTPPATFFGVGDRRQSIFGFRGSRPDLMTTWKPDAETVDLRECFRCGDEIVEAANCLIEHNHDTLAKPMIGMTGRWGGVEVFSGRSESVVHEARMLHDDIGLAWGEIAVLARTHRTLKRLAGLMDEEKMPNLRVGASSDVCDSAQFRVVLAALRLCANPRDNLAFLRMAEYIGFTSEQLATVEAAAAEKACSLWTAWNQVDKPKWCDEVAGADGSFNVCDVLTVLIEGGLHVMTSEVYGYWEDGCKDMSIEDAIHWHALRDSQDDLQPGNRVTLLTAHAAKGLEWPVVIICNCNEADFPSSQAIREDEEGIQEERRLFYVAMTRAKGRLMAHWRRGEDQSEGRKINPPSRFLVEAGLMEA